MKSIKDSFNGLASSLLLTAGLTRIAEKLDPMQQKAGGAIVMVDEAMSSSYCVLPCNFTSEAGQ